jgi:myo-inositol-1(or 4)-monophosphatase
MTTDEPRALRTLAERIAREAGDLAAAGRERGIEVSSKSTATDMVTQWDRAAESVILEGLALARPDDAVVGEEGGSRPGTTGLEWHVDPVDGTTNFLYGIPAWAVSVGVLDADGPVAGAVWIPPLGEMFSAHRGGGATRNGEPVRASGCTNLALALVGTGFGYDPAVRERQVRDLVPVMPRIRDIRRFGAASVDLCMVACGRTDAYMERGLQSWDLAAGWIIAVEAGAVVTAIDGGAVRPESVLAAAPGIHGAMVGLLSAG